MKTLGVTAFFVTMAMGLARFPLAGDTRDSPAANSRTNVDVESVSGVKGTLGKKLELGGLIGGQAGLPGSESSQQGAVGSLGDPSLPETTMGNHPGTAGMTGNASGPGGAMGNQPGPMMGGQSGPMMGGQRGPMMGGQSGPGGMMGRQPPSSGNMGGPCGMGQGGAGCMRGPQGRGPNAGYWNFGPWNAGQGDSLGFARLTTDTEAVERFLYDARQRIAITNAQDKAWNAFAHTIVNQIGARINMMNTMRKTVTDNPMDRTEQQLTALETMVKQRRALFQDFRTLHEQLTDAQRPMVEQLYQTASE